MIVLAGDIGGTKTLLGLFESDAARPRAVVVRAFTTLDHRDLASMISTFAADPAVTGAAAQAACFGVAGPVIGQRAELTNVPWAVDAGEVARAFDIPRVVLLNDLQAMAYAVPLLESGELHTLQPGRPNEAGNMALIAAGTGLGESLLHRVNGRLVPSPCEGGQADFAARTEREIILLRDLTSRYGRASVEHVLSGRGLVNLHRVTHPGPCTALELDDDDNADGNADAPAKISAAALERRCGGCVDALAMFVDAYGAAAGNLALRSMATAGCFVGGGIAPKILPAFADGRFMRAFLDKAPMDDLLSRIPVHVILNAEAGLLGAAVFATSGV